MDSALNLESTVGAASGYQFDYFLDAAKARSADAERLNLPVVALGVARVHAKELVGEERGFIAAGAGANLKDDVLVIIWIARRQQQPKMLFHCSLLPLHRWQFGLGELAQLGVVAFENQ